MARLKPIVLLGSSRADGETRRAVHMAFGPDADCIDLRTYNVSPYDYNHTNRDDDFLKLIDLITARDVIIFATPVYWYAMCAPLKAFFDRLSDLITIEKEKGRRLAGKTAWLLATGTDEYLPDGFEVPFARTCAYFAIHYLGSGYLYTDSNPQLRNESEARIKKFGLTVLCEQETETDKEKPPRK